MQARTREISQRSQTRTIRRINNSLRFALGSSTRQRLKLSRDFLVYRFFSQDSLIPSPKRSFQSFSTDQIHHQYVQKPATPPNPSMGTSVQKIDNTRSPGPESTDNAGRKIYDTENMGDNTSVVQSEHEELLRMCPDMIPLQQKAEEMMAFSQELFNGTFRQRET